MRKVKLIQYRLYDQSVLENMLNEEAQNGWNLKKIGYLFYHFEKEDQRKYYYVDLNYADQEYMENLKELGYQFIGNFQRVRIYASDTQLESLQTDPVVTGNILHEINHTNQWWLMLLCAFLFWMSSRYFIKFPWTQFNWLMHTEMMLMNMIVIWMIIFWLMMTADILVIRKLINQKMNGERQSTNLYRIISYIRNGLTVVILLLLGAYLLLSPTALTNTRIFIFAFMLIGYSIISFLYNRHGMSQPEKWKRAFCFGATVILLLLVQRSSVWMLSEENHALDEITAPYDMGAFRDDSSRFVQSRSFGSYDTSILYIHTKLDKDVIIDGYMQRMVYWDETGMSASSFSWSEVNGGMYDYEPVFEEDKYDISVFEDRTDLGIAHVYTYKRYHILVDEDVIVIAVCSDDKLSQIIAHYYS